jgi:hypothetical protein
MAELSKPPSPFSLASAALFRAREADGDVIFRDWQRIRGRFAKMRGAIDPVLDQAANIDILLRSFEGEIDRREGRVDGDTAGLAFHFQLSRMWVMSVYECVRQLHSDVKRNEEQYFKCKRATDSKGCGQPDCVACAIGHLKNEFALARIPIAKKKQAGDVVNPPLTASMKVELSPLLPAERPPNNKHLLADEGCKGGVIVWYVMDRRLGCCREISRRELSDRLLSWCA